MLHAECVCVQADEAMWLKNSITEDQVKLLVGYQRAGSVLVMTWTGTVPPRAYFTLQKNFRAMR